MTYSAVMWTLSSFLIYLFTFWAENPLAFSTLPLSLSSLMKEFVSSGHIHSAYTDSELHVRSARRKREISESFADFWPGSSSLERWRRCPDTGSVSRIFLPPASAKPARKLAVRFRSFWFLRLCLKTKCAAYLVSISGHRRRWANIQTL